MNSYNLDTLEKHSFFGEFYFSLEKSEGSFVGKINYSPESGLSIEYNISDSRIPHESDFLFGTLNDGERCTLFGKFNFYNASTTFCSGECGFYNLIIGNHIKENAFISCDFSFHNMQEFFHPQDHLDTLRYKDLIRAIDNQDWGLEVRQKITGKDVTNTLGNLIYPSNKEHLPELASNIEKFNKNFTEEKIYLRESIEFFFRYTTKSQKKAKDIFKEINKIISFFSIIMEIPAFPNKVKIYSSAEPKAPLVMLSGIIAEAKTITLAKRKINYYFAPIKESNFDFYLAIEKWMLKYDTFKITAIAYQYETGFRTIHSAYSDIILLATHIEDIAKQLGLPKNNKYEGPINRYGNTRLTKSFEMIFQPFSAHSLGRNIADLRNELAHADCPKTLTENLTLTHIVSITRLMKLVVASYILETLGLSNPIIHSYQDYFLNSICVRLKEPNTAAR